MCVFAIGRGALGGGIIVGVVSVGASGVGRIGCVVAVFLCRWSRYPLTMDTNGGGYFMMSLEVIYGHDAKNTEYIALHRVTSILNFLE